MASGYFTAALLCPTDAKGWKKREGTEGADGRKSLDESWAQATCRVFTWTTSLQVVRVIVSTYITDSRAAFHQPQSTLTCRQLHTHPLCNTEIFSLDLIRCNTNTDHNTAHYTFIFPHDLLVTAMNIFLLILCCRTACQALH